MTSHRHVTVWIDHSEARIFHVDAETLDEKTVLAPKHHLQRHPKGPTAEHNHPDDARRFFRSVAHELEGAERVLVVGPSTAKLQFIRYACEHDRSFESRLVGTETVDHPTDRQLVAYSKKYFSADDRMEGRPQTSTALIEKEEEENVVMKDPAISKAAQDLKAELDKSAKILRELREELRVRMHLGAMDVKDEWRRLEPRLEATLEQAGRDVSDATRSAVVEVTEAARRVRERLR